MLSLLFLILSILNSVYALISYPNCGIRPLKDSKIVNGLKTKPGDWAWNIALTNNGRYFCGGVLIDNSTVLTAATCFGGSSVLNPAYQIDIGLYNRINKETWVQTRKISKLYIHEKFSMTTVLNDIALIKLESPVKLDDLYIIPVCLDESENDLDLQQQIGWITGWGYQQYGGSLSNEKLENFITILETFKCQQRYGTLFNRDFQMCAGDTGEYSGGCTGDSGSPLVVLNASNLKWYLVGLYSWSNGCGQGSVFTKVKYYMPWINEKLILS